MSLDKQAKVVAKGGVAGKGNKVHPFMYEDDRLGREGEEKLVYL